MMQCRLNANADSYDWGGFYRFGRYSVSSQTETVRLEGEVNSQTETDRLEVEVNSQTETVRLEVEVSSQTETDRLEVEVNSQTETVRLERNCRLGVWAFILSIIRKSMFFCMPLLQALKFILPLFLLLFCGLAMQAQDKEKYLYQDSSVLYPQDTETVAKATNSSGEEEQSIVADTILINNGLYIPKDSVIAIKKEKPFAYATILDSLLKDMQQKQDVNYTVNTNRLSALDRFFSARFTKIFFWTIAALILGFIIIKLFFTEGFFQRKSASSNVKVLATEEDAAPDARDYNRLINKAIEKRDFRLATRYLYLQSLYRLIALGAVSFATDKTNHQYLAELATKPYQQAFAAITLQYEYVWYGGFTIDENRFAGIQQSFTNFNKQLPSLH